MRRVRQRRLRFLDESGVNLAMTRLHGRAPRGERVCERVPRNYGSHTSVISTLAILARVWITRKDIRAGTVSEVNADFPALQCK